LVVVPQKLEMHVISWKDFKIQKSLLHPYRPNHNTLRSPFIQKMFLQKSLLVTLCYQMDILKSRCIYLGAGIHIWDLQNGQILHQFEFDVTKRPRDLFFR